MRRSRWWTLAVACAGTALLLLDVSVVYVALPEIQSDLDADFGELQWVVDAYALALAATLLSAGSLSDRLGRRRVFVSGLGVFGAASLACGLAPSPVALDVARAAQGLGGAALFASSLALLAHEFTGRDRGMALSAWGAATGAALAVGPVVGGVLVDGLGWEWIFLLNVPLTIGLGLVTRATVRESRDPAAAGVDWPGVALFGAASFLVVWGLLRGNEQGWGSAEIVGAFTAGAALMAVFLVVERRVAAPMLPLGLFRDPTFSGTALVAFAQAFALYPMFLFVSLYLQDVLGYGPLDAGLRLLPLTLVLLAVAPLGGRLAASAALRWPLAAGLVLIGIAQLLLLRLEPASEWTALLPGLLVGGLAIGVISPALASATVAAVPPERTGLASGTMNMARQLGIAAGIAALGAILEHHVSTTDVGLAPGSDLHAAAAAVRGPFVAGLDAVFLVSALVALAAVPIALALVRARPAS